MRRCFYHKNLGQQYFTILKYELRSFNIQDDRSTRGLLAKRLNVRAFKKPLSVSFVKDNKLSLVYVFPKNKVTDLGAQVGDQG